MRVSVGVCTCVIFFNSLLLLKMLLKRIAVWMSESVVSML